MLSPVPCPPLVSPLECPGGDRLSALTPTRGLGLCICLWKDFCSVLLSPPSHLGYPLPSSGFSIVQNVPLPSRSVLRSLQGQARVPRPPGASSGSLLTPGMPLGWITLSVEQMGLIQSFCPDPNLQDPGQPSRPLPLFLPAPPLLHLPRLCRGKGCVFNKPLACFLGLPQGKEPLANP